jgi:hypothetical protein
LHELSDRQAIVEMLPPVRVTVLAKILAFLLTNLQPLPNLLPR